jgi:hypothetical protein
MENVKKQLHFIVLGAGVLVGVILLVVGIMIRGGTEDTLRTQHQRLVGAGTYYSQADVDAVSSSRRAFDGSLDTALTVLTDGVGRSLLTGVDTNMDANDFRSRAAPQAIQDLKRRYGALDRGVEWPEVLEDWEVPRRGAQQQPLLDRLDESLAQASQDRILQHQLELRILDELCKTAERLMESGMFEGGMRLVNAEFGTMGFADRRDVTTAPWEGLTFTIEIYCLPDFGAMLISELVRPTPATQGAPEGSQDGRSNFPIDLISAQWETRPRPVVARLDITPEMRAAYEIGADVEAGSAQLDVHRRRIERQLQNEVNLVIPARLKVQMRAKLFNNQWRGINPGADQ